VTKTIYSHEVSASVYKFVAYKTLLQTEGGYSTNEPVQLAVKEAIESAVIHLTVQGVRDRVWELANAEDWRKPLMQSYIRESDNVLSALDQESHSPEAASDAAPMRDTASLVIPPSAPLPVAALLPAVRVAAPTPTAMPANPAPAPVAAMAAAPGSKVTIPAVPVAPVRAQADARPHMDQVDAQPAPGLPKPSVPVPTPSLPQSVTQPTAARSDKPLLSADAAPVATRTVGENEEHAVSVAPPSTTLAEPVDDGLVLQASR
jgi:hypothetical protein